MTYVDFLRSRRYEHAATVTPSDGTPLGSVADALWVGTGGTVNLITVGGETVSFTVAANTLLPVACSQVKATGTTATNVVALWSKVGS